MPTGKFVSASSSHSSRLERGLVRVDSAVEGGTISVFMLALKQRFPYLNALVYCYEDGNTVDGAESTRLIHASSCPPSYVYKYQQIDVQ